MILYGNQLGCSHVSYFIGLSLYSGEGRGRVIWLEKFVCVSKNLLAFVLRSWSCVWHLHGRGCVVVTMGGYLAIYDLYKKQSSNERDEFSYTFAERSPSQDRYSSQF